VRDDASITKDVQARFAADAQTSPLGVVVDTKAGIVHLTGTVATDGDRSSVERIARDSPGVRSVDNDVRFGPASSPVKPARD
jgi:hyperosmotically inducible protein